MGERLVVECATCRDRNRCPERDLRYWHTGVCWAHGAEIIPCRDYHEDVRIETGYLPGRIPRATRGLARKAELVWGAR